jgi:hypothetical protein
MLSIQVAAQARIGQPGRPAQALFPAAAGSLVLLVAAGCTDLSSRDARATTPVVPPAPARAAVAGAPQRTAIEAALARGEEANTSAPLRAADAPAGSAGGPVLNPDAPKDYTVKRGDTLWGIASLFLRDPWLWPEIWHVNPGIANPHLIYPGDRVTLAYGTDGRPQLVLERGSAAAGDGQLQGSTRVEPLMRGAPLETAIPTIPYTTIAGFLGKPLFVSGEQKRRAPHIVALQDRHVAVGAPHEAYVTGLAGSVPGRYNIVRVGEALRDPATNRVLGYMGVHTGTARVDAPAKVSRATLVDSARETEAGDLLFREETTSIGDIVPRAPPARIDGQIIGVVDGVTMIGQYQVVAINRGARQGLQPGHVLALHAAGEVVTDKRCQQLAGSLCLNIGQRVRLPESRNGTLLVFKTYPDVSYGLTLSVTAPVRLKDRVRTP